MSFVARRQREKTKREPPRPRSDRTTLLFYESKSEPSSLEAARTLWTLNRSDGPRWTPATVRKALGKG